ncbi:MAG: class I mannose-6-phosphate isomerase [Lachnospiraceae bacterium]|nr:class I mannose-6-phosphate isomerase [Lachnospiraceae bacterium]
MEIRSDHDIYSDHVENTDDRCFETGPGLIRLNPVFKQMVWGGSRLRTEFGYEIPGDDTGECWAISAHRHGDCTVKGGQYDGKTLSWLWENRPGLFGEIHSEGFPLLVKIIDAKQDLSVQVHPDDEYARIHEDGSRGKTECWYILDCDPGASIIIGHNAASRGELADMIENNRWSGLLREVPVKKGDFFQIFPGTVHAIKGGTLILETQQNSDITYRVYDYGRLQNGRPRDLHIRQSLDVITVPFDENVSFDRGEPIPGGPDEALVKCAFYSVWHFKCTGDCTYRPSGKCLLCSVISGEGTVNGEKVSKADHFIIPAGYETLRTTGEFEMIVSSPE